MLGRSVRKASGFFPRRSILNDLLIQVIPAVHTAPQDDGFAYLCRADEVRIRFDHHAAAPVTPASLCNHGPLPSRFLSANAYSGTGSRHSDEVLRLFPA